MEMDSNKGATTEGSSEGGTECDKESKDAVVALTEHEKQIFGVLLDASAAAFPDRTVVLRVAGGWVRDKLLGRPSHDIDIAIDCMTGTEFAEAVRSFVDAHALSKKEAKVAVIRSNPEQSKHLETATMNVLDLPIDFVNLRCEEYSKESRIPTIVCFTQSCCSFSLLVDIVENHFFFFFFFFMMNRGLERLLKTHFDVILLSIVSSITSTKAVWKISLVVAWTIFVQAS